MRVQVTKKETEGWKLINCVVNIPITILDDKNPGCVPSNSAPEVLLPHATTVNASQDRPKVSRNQDQEHRTQSRCHVRPSGVNGPTSAREFRPGTQDQIRVGPPACDVTGYGIANGEYADGSQRENSGQRQIEPLSRKYAGKLDQQAVDEVTEVVVVDRWVRHSRRW